MAKQKLQKYRFEIGLVAIILAVYLPGILTKFMYIDDCAYYFKHVTHQMFTNVYTADLNVILANGRPLAALYQILMFGRINHIWEAQVGRVFGLISTIVLSFLILKFMKSKNFDNFTSFLFAGLVVILPCFIIWNEWLTCNIYIFGCILSYFAAYSLDLCNLENNGESEVSIIIRNVKYVLMSTALVYFAYLIYQPSASFFIVFAVIELVSYTMNNYNKIYISTKLVMFLISFYLASVLEFATQRILLNIFKPQNILERSELALSIINTVKRLCVNIIYPSLQLFYVQTYKLNTIDNVIAAIVGLIILVFLFKLFYKIYKEHDFIFLFTIIVLFCILIISSSIGTFVISSNIGGYRIIGPVEAIILFLLIVSLQKYEKVLVAILCISIFLSAINLNYKFIDVAHYEYTQVCKVISEQLHSKKEIKGVNVYAYNMSDYIEKANSNQEFNFGSLSFGPGNASARKFLILATICSMDNSLGKELYYHFDDYQVSYSHFMIINSPHYLIVNTVPIVNKQFNGTLIRTLLNIL